MNNDDELIKNNYCSSYSIDSFNNSFPPNNISNFFVHHKNIRSFNHNIDEFILFISNLNTNPDVIILYETFLRFTELCIRLNQCCSTRKKFIQKNK